MRLNRLSNISWLHWTPRTTITTKGPNTTKADPRNHNTTKSTTTTRHPHPYKEEDRKLASSGKCVTQGKICKPKIRLCKVELSILYGVRWAGHRIRIWVTCLPILVGTHPSSSFCDPRLHPAIVAADYVMVWHLMIVLRRHEIDVFANFAIELQSKRWREIENP